MLGRRSLMKGLAGLGLAATLPRWSGGNAVQAHEAGDHEKTASLARTERVSPEAGKKGPLDIQAIERWEDLWDDLDCVELAGRYTKLEKTYEDGERDSWAGQCPFCHAPGQIFKVEADAYQCLRRDGGCGAIGATLDFYARVEGLSHHKAVMRLQDLLDSGVLHGRRARQTELWKVMEEAARYSHRRLRGSMEGRAGRDWLERQGLTHDTVMRFGLGYIGTPDGDRLTGDLLFRGFRADSLAEMGLGVWGEADGYTLMVDRLGPEAILMPVRDGQGHCWGFLQQSVSGWGDGMGGDDLDGMQRRSMNRYRRLIFPLPVWPRDLGRYESLIITERPWDVVALHQAGITNAVHLGHLPAIQWGAGFRLRTALAMAGKLIYLYSPGQEDGFFFDHLSEYLGGSLDRLSLALLPKGHDLAEVIQREGRDGIMARIQQALPVQEFLAV